MHVLYEDIRDLFCMKAPIFYSSKYQNHFEILININASFSGIMIVIYRNVLLYRNTCSRVVIGGFRNVNLTTVKPQSSRPRFPFFNKHMKVTDPARQNPDHFEKLAHEVPLG